MDTSRSGKSTGGIYVELKQRLKREGLFVPDTRAYVIRTSWIIPVYVLGWTTLLQPFSAWSSVLALIAVAFASVQSAAIAHETAHGAVTKDKKRAELIGQFFMTFIFGSSYSSWRDKHGKHHADPNSGQDPDIRPGIFNFREANARAATGIARWATRHQPYLIWPAASLMGFSFKWGTARFIKDNARATRIDQGVLLLHLFVWIAVPSWFLGVSDALLNCALITWLEGINLALIFLTNHLGRPPAESFPAREFALRQAACARNLGDSWLLTRIFNGLNHHVEHHLFSNVSYSKLHLARSATKEMCLRNGIPYHEVTLLQAFQEFHEYNKRMAQAARSVTVSPAAVGVD